MRSETHILDGFRLLDTAFVAQTLLTLSLVVDLHLLLGLVEAVDNSIVLLL